MCDGYIWLALLPLGVRLVKYDRCMERKTGADDFTHDHPASYWDFTVNGRRQKAEHSAPYVRKHTRILLPKYIYIYIRSLLFVQCYHHHSVPLLLQYRCRRADPDASSRCTAPVSRSARGFIRMSTAPDPFRFFAVFLGSIPASVGSFLPLLTSLLPVRPTFPVSFPSASGHRRQQRQSAATLSLSSWPDQSSAFSKPLLHPHPLFYTQGRGSVAVLPQQSRWDFLSSQ